LPTYERLVRFRRDFASLTPAQQAAFVVAVSQFVEDLAKGERFRKGLRVKGVQGATGIFEMSWAGDGRATFQYAEPLRKGEAHIIWRRVGTHAILNQP
jgi:hypothetical protein